MFQRFKFVLLGTSICLLTACNTIKTTDNNTEDSDKNRLVKTAKINTQLGIAYLQHNNIQRSKQKLLLALDQAPNIPETWYSMAYFLEVTGNKVEAKKDYLKAIDIAPERGDAQNNYGTFLCRTGDYRGAIDRFLLAVKDKEYLDSAAAYENAGLCSLKIPDYKLAVQYFKLAVVQDPSRPSSLMELADTHFKMGNFKAARATLNQFLTVSPPTRQSLILSIKIKKKFAAPMENDPLLKENSATNELPTASVEKNVEPVVKIMQAPYPYPATTNLTQTKQKNNAQGKRLDFTQKQKLNVLSAVDPSKKPYLKRKQAENRTKHLEEKVSHPKKLLSSYSTKQMASNKRSHFTSIRKDLALQKRKRLITLTANKKIAKHKHDVAQLRMPTQLVNQDKKVNSNSISV